MNAIAACLAWLFVFLTIGFLGLACILLVVIIASTVYEEYQEHLDRVRRRRNKE